MVDDKKKWDSVAQLLAAQSPDAPLPVFGASTREVDYKKWEAFVRRRVLPLMDAAKINHKEAHEQETRHAFALSAALNTLLAARGMNSQTPLMALFSSIRTQQSKLSPDEAEFKAEWEALDRAVTAAMKDPSAAHAVELLDRQAGLKHRTHYLQTATQSNGQTDVVIWQAMLVHMRRKDPFPHLPMIGIVDREAIATLARARASEKAVAAVMHVTYKFHTHLRAAFVYSESPEHTAMFRLNIGRQLGFRSDSKDGLETPSTWTTKLPRADSTELSARGSALWANVKAFAVALATRAEKSRDPVIADVNRYMADARDKRARCAQTLQGALVGFTKAMRFYRKTVLAVNSMAGDARELARVQTYGVIKGTEKIRADILAKLPEMEACLREQRQAVEPSFAGCLSPWIDFIRAQTEYFEAEFLVGRCNSVLAETFMTDSESDPIVAICAQVNRAADMQERMVMDGVNRPYADAEVEAVIPPRFAAAVAQLSAQWNSYWDAVRPGMHLEAVRATIKARAQIELMPFFDHIASFDCVSTFVAELAPDEIAKRLCRRIPVSECTGASGPQVEFCLFRDLMHRIRSVPRSRAHELVILLLVVYAAVVGA
jgi:hypothetical protein